MSYQLQKTRYSHEALADVIIASPGLTHIQIAQIFERTPTWVSYVVNSDAFQMYLAQRKEALVDPVLTMTVEERLKGLAAKSCDILMEKLETIPDSKLALEALSISSKALGYGARGAQLNLQQNNYVVAMPGKAPNADAWESVYSGGKLEAGSIPQEITIDTEILEMLEVK